MAQRRPPVKYIRYYTDGSAARQPEIRPVRKPLPRPRKAKKPAYVLYVCPVALCGILAAAVLLVMMAVGSVQLYQAKQQQRDMAQYVAHLEWDNALKAEKYEAGLDLEEIRRQAVAMGMVPQEEVRHMEISVGEPD